MDDTIWEEAQSREIDKDFSGPTVDEFFEENPCLLEIGPISLTKLIYGDWLTAVKNTEEMSSEEQLNYKAILEARQEVANNFMKFFNIKAKK